MTQTSGNPHKVVGDLSDPWGFWQQVENFSRKEFQQRPFLTSLLLIQKLDRLRNLITDWVGNRVPVVIHVVAGKEGDHADGSYHYPEEHDGAAMAADIHFAGTSGHMLELMAIQAIGFGGIGFYPEWAPRPGWHLDVRQFDTPIFWTQPGDGEYHYGAVEIEDAIINVLGG